MIWIGIVVSFAGAPDAPGLPAASPSLDNDRYLLNITIRYLVNLLYNDRYQLNVRDENDGAIEGKSG
jgi:hypothetical protein